MATLCKQAVKVVVPVDRASDSGAVSRASASQKRATGRVFGSKNSMRWSSSSFLRPDPARFIALVGVVSTLTIGSFGAISRGLTGGLPSGYWVISSNAVPFSARRMAVTRAPTMTLPPPTAMIRSASAARAASVAARTAG